MILECGVRFKEIQQALNFDYSNCFALISHSHLDHCKAAKEVASAGIDIYCQKAASDTFKFSSHRINNFEVQKQFKVGEFTILPFPVSHDVPCVGFLIFHPECGKTLFITDSYYVEYHFKGLNNVLIEANYCETILEQRKEIGSIHGFLSDRIITSHMSLQTCMGVLRANDLTKVNNLVLIHLSDANSDAARFKREIHELTGKNVTVASKGLELSFNLQPF